MDASGNIFITEFSGGLQTPLRKITPQGVVTTLTNVFNSSSLMAGLVVDGGGDLFAVEEIHGMAIWRIFSNGPAAIFAGKANFAGGYSDGLSTNAMFSSPWGVALDKDHNLFLADRFTFTIRKIATNGIVSTLAGNHSSGHADGVASETKFYTPWSVAVDSAGAVYVADGDGTIRKGVPYTGAPVIIAQPLCQSVAPGQNATLSITVTSAVPISCQWQFQGADISGETNLSLTLTNVQMESVGLYRAVVTNELGSDASVLASLGLLGLPVSFSSESGSLGYTPEGMRMRLIGLVGQGQITVYASTNLAQWDPIYTNWAGFGTLDFLDIKATNFPQRFYRLTIPAAP